MKCLLHSRDLMFSSQVSSAACTAKVDMETLAAADQLVARAGEMEGDYLVLVDLTFPSLDIVAIAGQLREVPNAPASVIAVGPHVHEEKLTAATVAGCDHVLTKGQASRELASLFAELSSYG